MWEAIREFPRDDLDRADRAYARWLRRRLVSGTVIAWIVEVDATPVASGALWLRPGQPRPDDARGVTPYLMSMFTEPEHRRGGHGRAIVDVAMAWARGAGYRRIALAASPMGRPLYRSLGFDRTWEMHRRL
jgi:GNAT superfamily N-acetyltransferase